MRPLPALLAAALGSLALGTLASAQLVPSGLKGPGVPNFWVRPGYRVDLVAELPNVRFLEFGPRDLLFASRPAHRDIVLMRRLPNGVFRRVGTFVKDAPTVHGLSYRDGWLWFSQSGSVRKARDRDGDGAADEIVTVLDGLPSGGGHSLRSLLVTDEAIFTGIGDSDNASDESATERQKIWRFDKDGEGKTLWASGLRNTEKLRLRPGTSELYGADHGSDNWGASLGESPGRQPFTDLNPPDEFNRYDLGGFYGHPFVVGDRLPRLEYASRPDIAALAQSTTIPAFKFGAHNAPNGFAFAASYANLAAFGNDAYVAHHGSWNSTTLVGYKVERVLFDPAYGAPMGGQTMVSCLVPGLTGAAAILGRPCDVTEDPRGGMLFSDDVFGRVYRLDRDRSARR